jgi:hypothetical protein
MARIEWWRGVVLDAQLDFPGRRLARNLRYDAETKIDPRGHASRGDLVARRNERLLPALLDARTARIVVLR